MAHKPLLRRPTALGLALAGAAREAGIDVSDAALPQKREPSWSVTRKGPRRKGRRQ